MLNKHTNLCRLRSNLRPGARHVRCFGATSRFAIVGAGFAGLATAWNLLKHATSSAPVEVTVFDVSGIGAGGSGAAAGLLHSFSPKGKLLWRGDEAMSEALELLAVAETAAGGEQIAWRTGAIRPATCYSDAVDLQKYCRPAASGVDLDQAASGQGATEHSPISLTEHQARHIVPGLRLACIQPSEAGQSDSGGTQGKFTHTASVGTADLPAAFYAADGVTLQPQLYMNALWEACQAQCRSAGAGTSAVMIQQQVESLEALEKQHGSYMAVVVAAGAAAGSIQEVAAVALPLRLCQGYSLNMAAHETLQDYPSAAPSILGRTYCAVHGSSNMVVGASKKYGLQPDEALQLCKEYNTDHRTPEAEAAAAALLAEAGKVWPGVQSWSIQHIRSGVRALPKRTAAGTLPLLGKLPGSAPGCNWWLVGGLGSRGLVYHAWLAKLLVHAMLADDDSVLPQELTAWKANE